MICGLLLFVWVRPGKFFNVQNAWGSVLRMPFCRMKRRFCTEWVYWPKFTARHCDNTSFSDCVCTFSFVRGRLCTFYVVCTILCYVITHLFQSESVVFLKIDQQCRDIKILTNGRPILTVEILMCWWLFVVFIGRALFSSLSTLFGCRISTA